MANLNINESIKGDKLKAVFDFFDIVQFFIFKVMCSQDGDGQITVEEIKTIFTCAANELGAKKVVSEIDADGDQQVYICMCANYFIDLL